jgi:uncharacterized protein DUF3363
MLVPWRPVVEKELGRQASGLVMGDGISWEFGRKRGHALAETDIRCSCQFDHLMQTKETTRFMWLLGHRIPPHFHGLQSTSL